MTTTYPLPKTAAQLIAVLFARALSDAHQTLFAKGVAMAHLNYREAAVGLRCSVDSEVVRFSKSI